MATLANPSKRWHIVLRCTICGPLDIFFHELLPFVQNSFSILRIKSYRSSSKKIMAADFILLGSVGFLYRFNNALSMFVHFSYHFFNPFHPRVSDPHTWTSSNVQQWLEWAKQEYNLRDLDPARFRHLEGKTLCDMTKEHFLEYCTIHSAECLYAHLSFLRNGKYSTTLYTVLSVCTLISASLEKVSTVLLCINFNFPSGYLPRFHAPSYNFAREIDYLHNFCKYGYAFQYFFMKTRYFHDRQKYTILFMLSFLIFS